jgi:hypothetical protein
MVHAVRIKDGAASYCNHWVRTHKLAEEQRAKLPIYAKVRLGRVYCCCALLLAASSLSGSGRSYPGTLIYVCEVMGGGWSFAFTLIPRTGVQGHTNSLQRTHMGCLTWTVRAQVL